MIIKIIALILVLCGVVFIYDARLLSSKWFGFGDFNEATSRNKNFRLFIGNNRSFNFLWGMKG